MIDSSAAAAYERGLVPAFNTALAQEILRDAGLRAGDRVLDIACGTGIVVRLAAPMVAPGGAITGVDIDEGMLAVARSLEPEIPGITVGWHQSSAQALPFGDDTFGKAFCLQGLQYFPDTKAALAEARRVLHEGGRFTGVVWTSLEECRGQLALAHALERRGIDTSSICKAYSFGNPGRIRQLLEDADFADIDITTATMTARFPSARAFVDVFETGSLSSRVAISKIPAMQREAFVREVAGELQEYEVGGGLEFPLGYLVMRARKKTGSSRNGSVLTGALAGLI